MSERPAIVMTEREHLVRAIKDGLRKLEEHERKIEEHKIKRDEREVEVGTALKALKAQKPTGIKGEHYLQYFGIEIHRSYWLSGWVKTSKKGTKFLSLSVKPKGATAGGGSVKRDDSEIPF